MALGANVNVLTQIGAETTNGTAAAITRKLRSMTIDFDVKETIKPFQPMGSKFDATHVLNQQWSEAKVTGLGSYNELPYAFSSVMKKVTPVAVAVGTTFAPTTALLLNAYVRPTLANANGHLYKVTSAGTTGGSEPAWPTTSGGTVVSGSVTFTEVGIDVIAFPTTQALAVGALVHPNASPNGHYYKVTIGGTTAGTEPTYPTTSGGTVVSGTATLTEQGADPSAYQWDFDVSTEGVDVFQSYSIETGDIGRSWGRQSSFAVFNAFGLTSKRAGDFAISGDVLARKLSDPQAMTVANIADSTLVPISTQDVNFYIDTSAATLGNTQFFKIFDGGMSFKDRFAPAWTHDRSQPSFLTVVTRTPKLEVDLTVGDETELQTIRANFTGRQRMFVRMEAVGPAITPGVFQTARWDVSCQYSAAMGLGNEGESRIAKLKLGAEHDGTWGKATAARVVTNLSAL